MDRFLYFHRSRRLLVLNSEQVRTFAFTFEWQAERYYLVPPADSKMEIAPEMTTPNTTATAPITTPKMPANIKALILQDFNAFDEQAQVMIVVIKAMPAAMGAWTLT